jgi:hypothetical protein
MSIDVELTELQAIRHAGFALLEYAASLPDSYGGFSNKNGRWVCEPNFVTFEIHYKRAQNIRISLRGNPEEFEQHEELPLKAGMNGYSECSFESNSQLFAATAYIRRAWQIFNKGRARTKSRPVTIGE